MFRLPAIIALTLLTGCIIGRHPAGIAPSSAPLSANYTELNAAVESSCQYQILILPIGAMDLPDEIISRLVKESGGDSLINVIVELRSSTFALPIVGSTCTVVTGTVVKNVR
ncbi:MAG TPA: hypothetical protein VFA38_00575 [Nitrospirales bacterium]|nr:hypothetical protein [Nitrospirales bacterium]